jgi:hypothetical protein
MLGILLAAITSWTTQSAPAQEHERTLDEVRTAAEGGDALSQFDYALRLDHGTGVDADPVAAARWYEKAAEQGFAGAMNNLGVMLLDGRGVPENVAKGIEWIRRAGEKESGEALSNLGRFHWLGLYGLPKDTARATELSCAGARLGDSIGKADLRRYLPGEHLDLVGDSFDLSEVARIGEPLLIDVEWDARVQMGLRTHGGDRTESGRDQATLRLVDEFIELGREWKATRRYLLSQRTVDGEVRDDELNGAVMTIGITGNQRRAELAGGRAVSEKRLKGILNAIDSAGADVALPDIARIGEEFDLSLAVIAPLLFGLDGKVEESSGKARLESFDTDKKIARIAGKCDLTERDTDKDGELVTYYTFEVVIEMDLAARVIRSLRTKGECSTSGKRFDSPITGHAEFTASVRTSGAEHARKAMAAAPSYRDVVHKLDPVGVSLKLPSHFFETRGTDESEPQFSSWLGEGRQVTVALKSFTIGRDSMDAAMRRVEQDLVKVSPEVVTPKDTHCGLGKGRGITFVNEGKHFDVEMYPLGKNRILRVRVYGSETTKKALQQELTRFRASLQSIRS